MVRILPERIKEIIKKVTKNTAADPRSRMSTRQPPHRAASTMNSVRFRVVCSLSSVAAPAKINTILASSEGWMLTGPMKIQF